jgi:hypothetical protein
MPHSSKKRGHFRKTEKPPDVVHKKKPTYIPARRSRKETTMEKTPEKEPHGPPPPPLPPRTPRPTGEPATDEPKPGRPPHWHEGDPEPEEEEEEAKHLPPKDEK